jgi:hypothetical protein
MLAPKAYRHEPHNGKLIGIKVGGPPWSTCSRALSIS